MVTTSPLALVFPCALFPLYLCNLFLFNKSRSSSFLTVLIPLPRTRLEFDKIHSRTRAPSKLESPFSSGTILDDRSRATTFSSRSIAATCILLSSLYCSYGRIWILGIFQSVFDVTAMDREQECSFYFAFDKCRESASMPTVSRGH